ncbi:MAG: response regulator transcription factor [Chloroflexota bacterium]|jgi:DNA-binding NarL/FixJ family response regulator
MKEEKRRIKVLYIEDAAQNYEAVRKYLDSPDYELLPAVKSFSEARKAIAEKSPDVLLIDLKLPDEGNDIGKTAEIAGQIRKQYPKLTILIHSGESKLRVDVIRMIVAAGISYLVKEDIESGEQLDRAIRYALRGGVVFDRHVVDYLETIATAKAPRRFTDREIEVMALVADHLTNREIAAKLRIAPARVNELVGNILKKLAVERRSQIIDWYKEQISKGIPF